MKKLTKILALTLLVVMSMTILVGCAPNSDAVKAKATLEEKGYTVSPISILGLVWILTSGIDTDYVSEMVKGTKAITNDEGEVEKVESVTIIYFKESGHFFKDKYDEKVAWEELKASIIKTENPDGNKDFVVGKSGKMIYWGTKKGISATN